MHTLQTQTEATEQIINSFLPCLDFLLNLPSCLDFHLTWYQGVLESFFGIYSPRLILIIFILQILLSCCLKGVRFFAVLPQWQQGLHIIRWVLVMKRGCHSGFIFQGQTWICIGNLWKTKVCIIIAPSTAKVQWYGHFLTIEHSIQGECRKSFYTHTAKEMQKELNKRNGVSNGAEFLQLQKKLCSLAKVNAFHWNQENVGWMQVQILRMGEEALIWWVLLQVKDRLVPLLQEVK